MNPVFVRSSQAKKNPAPRWIGNGEGSGCELARNGAKREIHEPPNHASGPSNEELAERVKLGPLRKKSEIQRVLDILDSLGVGEDA